MRRIRSHPAAAGQLTRWIHVVKGKWQDELYTPNDMIPAHGPLPIRYGTPNGRWRQHWSNFEQSLLLLLLQPALRSSKEIVATFGWLEDLPMLVNQLQLFSFFIFFPVFHVNFVILLAQLANAYRCWAQVFSWSDLSFGGFREHLLRNRVG